LAKAIAILNFDKPIEITPLLPRWVALQLIERYSGPFAPMTQQNASRATVTLLSGYPYAFKGNETEKTAYMRRIEGVFALFPEWAGAAVVAVGRGLASTSTFLPNEAELTSALEAQVTKARSYAVKAQWHIDEAARREKQAMLDAECEKLAPDAKAELVSRLLLRPMSS